MTLTVTGIGSGTVGGWSPSSGTNASAIASDDGLTASGSSYSSTNANNAALLDVVMSDPTVAEEDMDATNPITSVRFLAVGRCPARGSGGSDVDFNFDTPSGFAETLNFFNNVNYEVEYGTTRTEQPDSSAWSYSDIENLQFNIIKNGTDDVHIAYFAVEVVYVAAAVTDNATFFGANF
tara:strand:+ start:330 stop:866 length:537 start_codon:yes stop_codon:yes gene_type:complete